MQTHTAWHRLPVAGGFSVTNGGISVYCLRCEGEFAPTPSWATRYLDRLRKELEREVKRGFMSEHQKNARLAKYEDRFRRGGLLE